MSEEVIKMKNGGSINFKKYEDSDNYLSDLHKLDSCICYFCNERIPESLIDKHLQEHIDKLESK